MKKIMSGVKNFIDDEKGVTAIEYGLIAALIGVAIVATVGELGQTIKNIFIAIAASLV